MNVCRRREKEADIAPEETWDIISLNDFKCTSCLSGTAYGYLFISLIISIAVYGVDTFTAINLLAFNRWSGELEPVISFNISKWIFSACIIASWVNLGFEYVRAVHVVRRGAVAESYLDSLAVRLQCIRMGKNGRGFRRFLVFAELTKSKKGVEYVALFTYFSFQSWIRIIVCQGPRQVVNALTLYTVFRAQLEPTESKDVGDAFVRFFKNVRTLADKEHQQAVIISGMLFTLVIWIFAALSLLLAAIFYVLFLWHYIPTADGSLAHYCERKINQRLKRIVSVKVNKALEADEKRRQKEEARAVRNGEKPILGRQATLPVLFDTKDDDKLPNMPIPNRNDTTSTLPAYSSRPGTPSMQATLPAFELEKLDQKRPYAGRTVTGSSTTSNAPLLGNASDMGYARSGSPTPSGHFSDKGQPSRSYTGDSYRPPPVGPPPMGRPPMGPPRMSSAASASSRQYTASPISYNSSQPPPFPRPIADLRSQTPMTPPPLLGQRTPSDPSSDCSSSAPMRMPPRPPITVYDGNGPPLTAAQQGRFQAYNPNIRSVSAAPVNSRLGPPQPSENMTDPMAPGGTWSGGRGSGGQTSLRDDLGYPSPDQSGLGGYR